MRLNGAGGSQVRQELFLPFEEPWICTMGQGGQLEAKLGSGAAAFARWLWAQSGCADALSHEGDTRARKLWLHEL